MFWVLWEELSPEPTNGIGMGIVHDCELELKVWIRDVVTIEGKWTTLDIDTFVPLQCQTRSDWKRMGGGVKLELEQDTLPAANTCHTHSSWHKEP